MKNLYGDYFNNTVMNKKNTLKIHCTFLFIKLIV